MSNPVYTIDELCQESGLSRRTIHFYVQQDLLPGPVGAGVGTRYNSEHLLRLQLIPILRSQGLRLDDIRNRLNGLAVPALEKLLAESTPLPQPEPTFLPTPQTYQHYELPAGMILVVPANLRPAERQHLAELLRAAHNIFFDNKQGS